MQKLDLRRRWLLAVSLLLVTYTSACFFLFFRQRQLIYRPRAEVSSLPSAPDFGLDYEDVWIPVANENIHGWWMPAIAEKPVSVLPDEPAQILTSPKTMLYFCGVGNNMSDYNYLARVSAFRQLGFSVLVFDYRGYGLSEGGFPREVQLYEDAEAVWDYLREVRGVPAEQIVIYGESMGGAIALDLAIKYPEASGLIMQSSFTSMSETIQSRTIMNIFPVNAILTERFESLDKIKSLKMPVLFVHGQADSVVPVEMSQQLHEAAPGSKQLFLIPNADHVSIYQSGEHSYLSAIERFMAKIMAQ